MPNRILKETICSSDNLDLLDAETERFFYRLLVQCDDYGRMDARPAILRARCFPLKLDQVGEVQISQMLAGLVRANLIFLYQSDDGKPYLQMITWEKHQQIRAHRSKYPEPKPNASKPATVISDDINGNQPQANVPENPIQSKTTTTTPSANDISGRRPDPDFGELCQSYEKNIGLLTPAISENIQADLASYGLDWCIDAINEAVLQNKRKWSYVQGILNNWSVEGRREKPPTKQRDKPVEHKTVEIILSDGSTSEARI